MTGPAVQDASGVLVMLHGRGANAESILELHRALGVQSLAAVAPQATGNSWYPYSFLARTESNQPHLDSALARVEAVVVELLTAGANTERIAVLGFSQGACLACEFVARHPRRYGALIAFTGGLIGPEGTPRGYEGSLQGTPIFLGSSDPDPHVPFARVRETKTVFEQMGASVQLRRYPGMPHTISDEELDAAREILLSMTAGTTGVGI